MQRLSPHLSCGVILLACATAGVAVENEWEREMMDQMRPSKDLWRSMAKRALAR